MNDIYKKRIKRVISLYFLAFLSMSGDQLYAASGTSQKISLFVGSTKTLCEMPISEEENTHPGTSECPEITESPVTTSERTLVSKPVEQELTKSNRICFGGSLLWMFAISVNYFSSSSTFNDVQNTSDISQFSIPILGELNLGIPEEKEQGEEVALSPKIRSLLSNMTSLSEDIREYGETTHYVFNKEVAWRGEWDLFEKNLLPDRYRRRLNNAIDPSGQVPYMWMKLMQRMDLEAQLPEKLQILLDEDNHRKLELVEGIVCLIPFCKDGGPEPYTEGGVDGIAQGFLAGSFVVCCYCALFRWLTVNPNEDKGKMDICGMIMRCPCTTIKSITFKVNRCCLAWLSCTQCNQCFPTEIEKDEFYPGPVFKWVPVWCSFNIKDQINDKNKRHSLLPTREFCCLCCEKGTDRSKAQKMKNNFIDKIDKQVNESEKQEEEMAKTMIEMSALTV